MKSHRSRMFRRKRQRGLQLRMESLEQRQMLAADPLSALEDNQVFHTLTAEQIMDAPGENISSSKDRMLRRRSIPATRVEDRSFDGTGNNLQNPEFGSAGVQLVRIAESDYADGISELAGENRPDARAISNALAAADPDARGNERQLSAFVYVWGQFLDHDIDLTGSDRTESADIAVPAGDPIFDPNGTGTQVIEFFRSEFDPATGNSLDDPRQQLNVVTAFVDGSQVYGSDQETADSLRSFESGKMLTSTGSLLPVDEVGNFLAGDVRVNENIELTSMHTLFVREHNGWADQIASRNPESTDEEIYQQARAIVIAEMQVITYEEFLPALLGEGVIPDYQGYDPTVNPGIANEFSTAAFRLGHSLLNDDVEFFGDDGRAVRDEITLAEGFFNPDLLRETGIDSILKYSASSQSQELDNHVVDSLRNFLIEDAGDVMLDLASLNIQRGRDHGLDDYNSVREAYGLERVNSFTEITSNVELQQTLQDLYATVDAIDLWVGALAEDHVGGSSAGETVHTIVADQFTRLRDGDRFWYANTFSEEDVRQLERTTLADVIKRNTNIANLQKNVFFMSATVSGRVLADGAAECRRDRGERGVPGVTVELLDDETQVVATTVTDSRGYYSFDNFLETGDYQVRVLRSTAEGIAEETIDILISRGALVIRNLDFGGNETDKSRPRRDRRDANDRPVTVDAVFESSTGLNGLVGSSRKTSLRMLYPRGDGSFRY